MQLAVNGLTAKLYYHILGTDQSEDVLIHRNPENPEWSSYIFVTWHGDYMCLDTSRDTAPANKFWIAKVKDGVLPADSTPFNVCVSYC